MRRCSGSARLSVRQTVVDSELSSSLLFPTSLLVTPSEFDSEPRDWLTEAVTCHRDTLYTECGFKGDVDSRFKCLHAAKTTANLAAAI